MIAVGTFFRFMRLVLLRKNSYRNTLLLILLTVSFYLTHYIDREQYCITRKEIKTFEDKRSKKLFGCLVKGSCAGSSKDKKSKRSSIQSDEPSVAYGDDNNRQSG